MPLQEGSWHGDDSIFGVNSPALVAWAEHSQAGRLVNATYGLLLPYLLSAIFVPGLFGKRQAKTFLVTNLMASGITLPFVAAPPRDRAVVLRGPSPETLCRENVAKSRRLL